MKVTRQIDLTDVEAVSRWLKTGKVSTERFSIELPVGLCAHLINGAVKAVVELNRKTFRESEAYRDQIRKAARWLTDPDGKIGLFLGGLCGNGKTTLANAIKLIIEKVSEESDGVNRGKKVAIISAKTICSLAVSKERTNYARLFDEEILIIDDLGTEPLEVVDYGSVINPVTDILFHRYDRQLMTIITSNKEAPEIKTIYGERIYDRFKEMLEPIIFTNESYR